MAPATGKPTWVGSEGRVPTPGSSPSDSLREGQALLDDDELGGSPMRDRRRSSTTNRLAAMADIGGVNSFRSFARSWQRAAAFTEVLPRRPSFVYADERPVDDPSTEDLQYGRSYVPQRPAPPSRGLLSAHLESSQSQEEQQGADESRDNGEPSTDPIDDSAREDFRERESKAFDAEMASGALLGPSVSSPSRSSIFANPPHLATSSIIGSYGSHRGSAYGTMGRGSMQSHRPSIGLPGEEDEEDEEDAAHGEHEPILVKEVKQGDKVILTVEGQSTMPQSVFNSINAIIGVGILSLPLAFKLSGWIIGLVLLTLTATVTAYTGKLLAKCMDADPSLITYSDLAYVSFGSRARVVVSALFSLELVAACVALVILFADSLEILLPGLATVDMWKCVCAALILLLNALPLRFLSYTSVIGIFSTFCIVCIVILDGLVKDHAPGSLREPASTHLLPTNWLALPLAYGLLASPWGAHSVFPSIYRDMRHPAKWGKAVTITFSFSYVLDTCLAIIGIIMFGDGISDAITSNILRTTGYPRALTIIMCVFVAIIPLTKIPLNARPLITTADVLCGVHEHAHHHHGHRPIAGRAKMIHLTIRGVIRTTVVLVLLLISILFPAFDSVCAFLGAALCTLISIILPISFYLKLYWKDIEQSEATFLWLLLAVFSVLGTVGTVWTFLPKEFIGI